METMIMHSSLLKIFLLISLVYSSSGLGAASHWVLKNYQADYTLQWLGLNVGTSRHMLLQEKSSASYIAQSRSSPYLTFLPFGDLEESTFNLSNHEVRSYKYTFRSRENKKKLEGSILFDWKSSILIKSIKGKPAQKEPFKGKIYDKITHIFQLRHDLKLKKKDLTYTVVEPEKTKTYHYTVIGTEILKTPIGNLDTIKLTHISDNKERRTELWLAKDFDYLMVKLIQIRKGKKTAEANIQRVH
jgi:hypothetical protein